MDSGLLHFICEIKSSIYKYSGSCCPVLLQNPSFAGVCERLSCCVLHYVKDHLEYWVELFFCFYCGHLYLHAGSCSLKDNYSGGWEMRGRECYCCFGVWDSPGFFIYSNMLQQWHACVCARAFMFVCVELQCIKSVFLPISLFHSSLES